MTEPVSVLPSDRQLLEAYVTARDEGAFRALVERYAGLVHGAAGRQVRDPGTVEDVAQAVFILLARKAPRLNVRGSLAGWLVQTTHYCCRDVRKRTQRRTHHEREAAIMRPETPATEPGWPEVAPRLDTALARLPEADRTALALRYLQGQSAAEMGQTLGLAPPAAQKRLTRAVDRLRKMLGKQGLSCSTAGLAAVLLSRGPAVVPAPLVAKLAATALLPAAGGPAVIAQGAAQLMLMAKVKAAAMVVGVVVAIGGLTYGGMSVLEPLMFPAGGAGGHGAPVRPTLVAAVTPEAKAAGQGEPEVAAPVIEEEDKSVEDRTTTGLKPRSLGMTLARDAQGNVWMGTENEGLWRYGADKKWEQHNRAKGELRDNSVYALAVDRKGRLWVGHRVYGVTVFNGKSWRNYDALSGPIGNRVFAIATSPIDGDVWIATDAGLTRYGMATDTWTHVTRLQGLPADQASALAFDGQGRLYVGLQADGLAYADPGDNYGKFVHVPGPAEMPWKATGTGLPSTMVNAVSAGKSGVVYVGTPWGIGRSTDRGKTWSYVRGKDLAEKTRQINTVAKLDLAVPAVSELPLAEDYVTSLAEGSDGVLWVGYRTRSFEAFSSGWKLERSGIDDGDPVGTFITALLPDARGECWFTCYVGEAAHSGSGKPAVATGVAEVNAPLPRAAAMPTTAELTAAAATVKKLGAGEAVATYLRDDWMTQGDWIGRYGSNYAVICAASSPMSDCLVSTAGYGVNPFLGPQHDDGDSFRLWLHWLKSMDRRVLYHPPVGTRRQGEWNDASFGYKAEYPGPDLWLTVTVPEGTHRLSLYCINKDGRTDRNRSRDFLVELKCQLKDVAEERARPHLRTGELWELPTVAQTRVRDFWSGVYKTFLVTGPREYHVKMQRNGSYCVIVSGVFMDRVSGKEGVRADKEVAGMAGVKYAAPAATGEEGLTGEALARVKAARELWAALDEAYGNVGSAAYQRYYRTLAYRAAVVSGAKPELLKAWRWKLGLWTPGDRDEFDDKMVEAWGAYRKVNPNVKNDKSHGPGDDMGG